MAVLTLAELTETTLDGTGVFDTLMRANKAHLEAEFSKGRIKGTEYATVYLGSLETVMRSSMEFLLQRDKNNLEAQLLEQQILLAQVKIQQANAELAILQANLTKIPAEIAQLTAQTAQTIKQTSVIDQEILLKQQQVLVSVEDVLVKKQQVLVATSEVAIAQAKLVNIPKEGLQLDAQTALVNQQVSKETSNNFVHPTDVKLSGTNDQQRQVLVGQKCKLDAEFDLLQSEKLKSASETALLAQKNATERAQTTELGVDANSVIGKQKSLYQAQTEGFARDAEQKAAKLMVDTWNVRRTTDPDAADINATNQLTDASVGRAVAKLLGGVGA